MSVDLGFADWLKQPALFRSWANGTLPSPLLPMAVDSEIISPFAASAAVDTEIARQAGVLGSSLAVDVAIVKGRLGDRVGKCVNLVDDLGFAPQTEMVTNGDGSSITGWTASGATLSSTGGRLRVTNTAGFGRARQSYTTNIGQQYRLNASLFAGTAPPQVIVGSTLDGFDLYNQTAVGPSATTFTATTATTYLAAIANSATVGQYAEFDDISLKPIGQLVFVIGAQEQDDGTTQLTVLRKL